MRWECHLILSRETSLQNIQKDLSRKVNTSQETYHLGERDVTAANAQHAFDPHKPVVTMHDLDELCEPGSKDELSEPWSEYEVN